MFAARSLTATAQRLCVRASLTRAGVAAKPSTMTQTSKAMAATQQSMRSFESDSFWNSMKATKTTMSPHDKAAFMKYATGAMIHMDENLMDDIGLTPERVYRNISVGQLYEHALAHEDGSVVASSGALIAMSGKKTGRSPLDKRVVEEESSSADVWWGAVNKKLTPGSFMTNRERAIDYLSQRERLYVIDAFAGADLENRIKVRVVTSRAYHALFMWNMLIRPTDEELADFGNPDYTIYNAGAFPANRRTLGMTSGTSVALDFSRGEMVILGTQYAGEMKKGVFTIMNYLMPKKGILSMHASCNVGKQGDVSVFFGLSGTGKTTLSSDSERHLIGDDEHCWTDNGVFNIEGGCYAKAVNLSKEQEPEIYNACKFGAVLENVVYDKFTREVDFTDTDVTENTRLCYPLSHIENAAVPSVAGHPTNIIMLTCDAFGVLPPVSQLTPEQAMYHFMSGYTAKIAGTEEGVTEPEATFSACFGAPFLVWHPAKYAELLAEKMKTHNTNVWLVNTGWSGGAYGTGERLSLKHTRSLIDAIHSGELADAPKSTMPVFGFQVPTTCSVVPDEILMPKQTWADKDAYDQQLQSLAVLFQNAFEEYKDGASQAICDAGPKLE